MISNLEQGINGYWALDPILRAFYRDLELFSARFCLDPPVLCDAGKLNRFGVAESIYLKNPTQWGARMRQETAKKYPMLRWDLSKTPVLVEMNNENAIILQI